MLWHRLQIFIATHVCRQYWVYDSTGLDMPQIIVHARVNIIPTTFCWYYGFCSDKWTVNSMEGVQLLKS